MRTLRFSALGTALALFGAVTASPAAADVTTTVQQNQTTITTSSAASNAASTTDAATGASGTTGLNTASGIANEQSNVLNVQPASTTSSLATSQTQTGGSGSVTDYGSSNASIGGSTLSSSTGNAGVNDAAGTGNQQGNVLNASQQMTPAITTTQTQSASTASVTELGSATTSVTDMTARGSTGNVGLNSAAGSVNQQQNALSVGGATNGTPTLTSTNSQTFGAASGASSPRNSASVFSTNTTGVGGQAGSGVNGNIGVNAAAGSGNAQANSLSIGGDTGASAVDTNQSVNQAYSSTANASVVTSNSTTLDGSAVSGVSGVATVNAATGAQNAQTNTTVVVGSPAVLNIGAPTVQTTTQSSSNTNTQELGSTAGSTIDGSAGSKNAGVTGMNAAAGLQNAQANSTAAFGAPVGGNSSQNTTQSITGGKAFIGGSFTATIGGNAAQGTTGVAAINNAAGDGNMQSNQTLFQSAPKSGFHITGGTQNTQGTQSPPAQSISATAQSGRPALPLQEALGTFTSSVTGNTGAGSTGVLSVNSASGSGNQQSNQTQIQETTSDGGPAYSTQGVNQNVTLGAGNALRTDATTTAKSTIDGTAGSASAGEISLNSAAGQANQQETQISILAPDPNPAIPVGSANPTVASAQNIATSTSVVTNNAASESAGIGGAALSAVQGVAAGNSAAGTLNQQGTVVLVEVGGLAAASPSSSQTLQLHVVQNGVAQTASLGGSAFSGSSGVVSGNVASGVGSQQLNTVEVFTPR